MSFMASSCFPSCRCFRFSLMKSSSRLPDSLYQFNIELLYGAFKLDVLLVHGGTSLCTAIQQLATCS